MPAKQISINNAKQEKLFYFVANVVVYRERDGRCLVLKRSDREKVHPGKYCVMGGKLEWKDLDIYYPTRVNGEVLDFENAVEDLLVREVAEEAGITIVPKLWYLNSVAFIRPDETPVILVKFAAKYSNGEVVLEKESFSEYAWVTSEEVRRLDCIKRIPEEITQTIALFANK